MIAITIVHESRVSRSLMYANVVRSVLGRACRMVRCPKEMEVAVVFVVDAKMRELNRKYRGKDKTTNVLAFAAGGHTPPPTPPPQGGETETISSPARGFPPLPEGGRGGVGGRGGSTIEGVRDLGDIFISLPEARREAKKYGWPLNYEIARLVVHGFLHLLGYDHVKENKTQIMERIEKKILRNLYAPLDAIKY